MKGLRRNDVAQGTKAGIKLCIMFFKKRVWVPPAWWVRMNERQQRYARRLADWLGRKTAKVPAARMRVYVVLFLIGMAGLNLALVWRQHSRALPVPLDIPGRVIIERPRPPVRVDLRHVLDSLRSDSVGSRVFDSLLRARPGLADTLKMVEALN
jgi:hypothetical protein